MKKIVLLLLTLILCFVFTACGGDSTDSADLAGVYNGTYMDGTIRTLKLNEDGTGTFRTETSSENLQWQAGKCLLYSQEEDLCINLETEHKAFEVIVDGDTIELKMGDYYHFTKQ